MTQIQSFIKFLSQKAGVAFLMMATFSSFFSAFAQEADTSQLAPVATHKPAKPAFESGQFMDEQSVLVPASKTLEFNMQHRFGLANNGVTDLYGIYAPGANIRFNASYVPMNNLQVGFGYAMLKKYLDFNVKYAILKQRKDWTIPVSVTFFGDWAIDNRKDIYIKAIHRYSYFGQLIIASRITDRISVQISPSFSHYNAADTLYKHDMLALGVSGRYKFSNQSSILVSYTQQFGKHKDPKFTLKPGLSVGWEIATSGHAFQFFASTFQGIIPQENIMFNGNDFMKGHFLIGFNITRLWNF